MVYEGRPKMCLGHRRPLGQKHVLHIISPSLCAIRTKGSVVKYIMCDFFCFGPDSILNLPQAPIYDYVWKFISISLYDSIISI